MDRAAATESRASRLRQAAAPHDLHAKPEIAWYVAPKGCRRRMVQARQIGARATRYLDQRDRADSYQIDCVRSPGIHPAGIVPTPLRTFKEDRAGNMNMYANLAAIIISSSQSNQLFTRTALQVVGAPQICLPVHVVRYPPHLLSNNKSQRLTGLWYACTAGVFQASENCSGRLIRCGARGWLIWFQRVQSSVAGSHLGHDASPGRTSCLAAPMVRGRITG